MLSLKVSIPLRVVWLHLPDDVRPRVLRALENLDEEPYVPVGGNNTCDLEYVPTPIHRLVEMSTNPPPYVPMFVGPGSRPATDLTYIPTPKRSTGARVRNVLKRSFEREITFSRPFEAVGNFKTDPHRAICLTSAPSQDPSRRLKRWDR